MQNSSIMNNCNLIILQILVNNVNNCSLLFFLPLPQFASIMQEPSIGRPLYIRVVRTIIETEAVSGSAILSVRFISLKLPALAYHWLGRGTRQVCTRVLFNMIYPCTHGVPMHTVTNTLDVVEAHCYVVQYRRIDCEQ